MISICRKHWEFFGSIGSSWDLHSLVLGFNQQKKPFFWANNKVEGVGYSGITQQPLHGILNEIYPLVNVCIAIEHGNL